jgi:hypothetical protein
VEPVECAREIGGFGTDRLYSERSDKVTHEHRGLEMIYSETALASRGSEVRAIE